MKNKIKVGARVKVRIRHVNANSGGGRTKIEAASVLGIYGNFVLLGFGKFNSCAYISDILSEKPVLI